MRTVNVAAAAVLALVLSILMSPTTKAQTPDRDAARNPPAAAARAAPRIGVFHSERADTSVCTPRLLVQMPLPRGRCGAGESDQNRFRPK